MVVTLKRTTAALLLCAFTACKHGGGGVSTDAGASFHPSPPPRTESSAISITNLDGDIALAEKRSAEGDAVGRKTLPAKLLTRAGALGTLDDFDRADDLSAKNVVLEPNDGPTLLARAHVLSALHRFDEALAELDAAGAHKGDPEDIDLVRAEIFLATGRCAEAAKQWPARPYAIDMAARGAMEQRLGHPELAESLFERARTEYRDVSPIKFAWMDFERARAFEREGDTMRARVYLEDALDAFPEYAHAATHAALVESPDRALAILAPVERRSNDPDVIAAHADALRRARRDADAAPFVARARARFEEILAKHPEAFADHAARFFLGEGGDVKRALDLAKSAAAKAPTEETLELWLTAARASSSDAEACAAVAAADKTTCPLRGSRAQFDAARAKCPH
jgi:tetratricopeptide (TPR) repeat protein